MKQTKIFFAAAIILSGLMFSSCKHPNEPADNTSKAVTLSCVKPAYLQKGDKVALISPSYFTPMENVYKTADVLRSWGLEPIIGSNVGKEYEGKYAGTIAERVSDIRWAMSNPDIKAIICNRGGYGTIQLIDLLSYSELSQNPKWLCGFSDIST